ncbi:unnamed protein product [Closterium sp. Naga37s-1]|nr:unnamed protein product [Closterium sp. Naga37s-1]
MKALMCASHSACTATTRTTCAASTARMARTARSSSLLLSCTARMALAATPLCCRLSSSLMARLPSYSPMARTAPLTTPRSDHPASAVPPPPLPTATPAAASPSATAATAGGVAATAAAAAADGVGATATAAAAAAADAPPHHGPGLTISSIRALVLILNIPPLLVSLQGFNVLQLFLLVNLINTTSFLPLLLGVLQGPLSRVCITPASSATGCASGLLALVVWAKAQQHPGETYVESLARTFLDAYDYPPYLIAVGISAVGMAVGAGLEWLVRC